MAKCKEATQEVNDYVPTSVTADGIKLHGKLQAVDDMLQVCR